MEQADVVFVGTVLSKELRETEPQWFVYLVSLEVSSSWKGLVREEMAVATNSDSLGSFCGYFFEAGQDYLIYGNEENEGDLIFTGLCTRTKLLKDAQDEVTVLNRATEIEPSPIAGLAGDFNGDGKVSLLDFFLFADAFGGTDPEFDLSGDGKVNLLDFFLFADAFGNEA